MPEAKSVGGGELFFSFWEVLREVRDFITHLSCIHYIYIQYNSAVKSGKPTFEGGGGGMPPGLLFRHLCKGPSQKYLEANEVKYFSLLP